MPAAAKVLHGALQRRLLDEAGRPGGGQGRRGGGEHGVRVRSRRWCPAFRWLGVAQRDVSQPRRRRRRGETHRGQPGGDRRPARGGEHGRPVGIVVVHERVSVNGRDDRLRVVPGDLVHRQAERRAGAAGGRLRDHGDGAGRDSPQGAGAAVDLARRGDDMDGVGDGRHPVDGGAQQRLSAGPQRQEVLGDGRAAQRPQPGATATGEDEDVKTHRRGSCPTLGAPRFTRLAQPPAATANMGSVPAASARSSALSVRSQGRSRSLRPK